MCLLPPEKAIFVRKPIRQVGGYLTPVRRIGIRLATEVVIDVATALPLNASAILSGIHPRLWHPAAVTIAELESRVEHSLTDAERTGIWRRRRLCRILLSLRLLVVFLKHQVHHGLIQSVMLLHAIGYVF